MTLDDKEKRALERILDIVLPLSVPQLGPLNVFYSKQSAKEQIIQEASKDPLISIKIRNIFTILKQIFQD